MLFKFAVVPVISVISQCKFVVLPSIVVLVVALPIVIEGQLTLKRNPLIFVAIVPVKFPIEIVPAVEDGPIVIKLQVVPTITDVALGPNINEPSVLTNIFPVCVKWFPIYITPDVKAPPIPIEPVVVVLNIVAAAVIKFATIVVTDKVLATFVEVLFKFVIVPVIVVVGLFIFVVVPAIVVMVLFKFVIDPDNVVV
jgi:hypothetical protein